MNIGYLQHVVINGRIPYNPETTMFEFYASTYFYRLNEEKVEVIWNGNRFAYRLNDRANDHWFNLFKIILHAAFCAAFDSVPRFVVRYNVREYDIIPDIHNIKDGGIIIATIYPIVF